MAIASRFFILPGVKTRLRSPAPSCIWPQYALSLIHIFLHSRRYSPDIHKFVKGVMIESYLEPGSQKIGEHIYGKSITDPCLGWEESERLLYDIAEEI